MKLTANQIADIESIEPGTVAEVRLTDMGFIVTKRPRHEEDIEFPFPILLSADDPCELRIEVKKRGDIPVHLWAGEVPANYYLKGIRGYQGR